MKEFVFLPKLPEIMKIKHILLFSIFIIFINCSTNKVVVNRKIVNDEKELMLLGRITPDALNSKDFEWYLEEYNSYVANKEVINKFKNRIKFCRIEVYMGTWCSDTHEQLPRFIKILDQIRFPKSRLSIYALNRKMESFYGEQAQKAILKVPTIIVYHGTEEIGRIVETPENSLELDLYKIVTGKEYK